MQFLPFLSVFSLTILAACAFYGPELKTSHPEFHGRRLSKLASTDDSRLPDNARPLFYQVTLTFNPNENQFTGKVIISLDVDSTLENKTNSLKLNSAINFGPNPTFQWNDWEKPCTVSNLTTVSIITITCPESIEGNNQNLTINYVGNLSSVDEYGAYQIYYNDPDSKIMIATQLEQAYARRLFPCFDEPKYKAPIQLTLKTTEKNFSNWISNTRVQSESSKEDTIVTTTFEPTPKMSTYLLAFVITSDFKKFPSSVKTDYDLDIFARPTAEKNLNIALQNGPQLIGLMENFTEIKYTDLGNDKMTFAAIPEFKAGAMENWGLITFREELLIDEGDRTTERDSQTIIAAIAHELAHQWFGDYVTLDWWSEAWLNEGFAEYFQYYLPNKISPDLDMLKQFVVKKKQQALKTDADPDSMPLSNNASEVTSDDDFWAEFGDISYIKGASIIKILHYTLGDDAFQKGLNAYLKENKYSSSTAKILIDTLQKQISDKTISLEKYFKDWIYESGYPLLDVSLDSKNKVTIQATKFSSSGTANKNSTPNWWIPLTFTTSDKPDDDDEKISFQWTETANISDFSVELPDNNSWIILNLQSIGYYRVNYDQTLWNRLISVLNNSKTFSKIDVLNRAQLLDDIFNVAKYYQTEEEDGNLYYLTAFNLAQYLKYETEYHPWYTFFTEMQYLLEIIQDSDTLSALKEKIGNIITPQLKIPQESDKLGHTEILKQNLLLSWACKMGNEDCVKWAQTQYQNYMKDTSSIDNNYRDVILCTGLTNASSDDFDKILGILEKSTLPFEQTDLLTGLTCTNNDSLINKLLLETNNPPKQSKFSRMLYQKIISNLLTSGSEKITVALKYVLSNITEIRQNWQMITDPETLLKEISSKIYSQAHIDILTDFINKNKDNAEYENIKKAAQEAIEIAKKNIEYLTKHSDVLTSVILYDGEKIPPGGGGAGDSGNIKEAFFMLTALLSGLSLAQWGLLSW